VVLQVAAPGAHRAAAPPRRARRCGQESVRRLRADLRVPRVAAELAAAGWQVSVNTVAASMAAQQLVARRTRRRQWLTRADKTGRRSPDLVGRDFTADGPNRTWCGDLTEIPTDEGKLYLAAVEDLFSRRALGYAIGEHHDADLASASLQMAAAVRGGTVAGVVFHTDQAARPGSSGRRNIRDLE